MTPDATEPARWRKHAMRAAVLAFLGLLAVVTLPANASTRMNSWPWWLGQQLLFLLPVVALAARGWARVSSGARMMPGYWHVVLVAIAAVFIASALLSVAPAESLNAAMLPVVTAAGICLLAEVLLEREQAWSWLTRIAAWAGVVFAAVSLTLWLSTAAVPTIREYAKLNTQLGAEVFRLHPDGFRNISPLGHSNYTAGVSLLLLPWVVLAAARARGMARWLWGTGVVLVFATLISSGSRGAVLGLMAGGAFAVILWARAARWSATRTVGVAMLGLVALVALALTVPRVRNSITARLRGAEISVGDQQRVAMTQIGFAMGREHWWHGVGPGLSTRLYPKYRNRVEGGVDMALQLHSTPIQLWAETGLPGCLAVGMLTALALVAAVRASDLAEGRTGHVRCGAILAAGSSFAAYAGFALTDFQFDLPVVAAVCATDLAVLGAAAARVRPTGVAELPTARRRRSISVVAMVVGLGAIVVVMPESRARQIFAHAVAALETGGPVEAFNEQVVRAARWRPRSPEYLVGGAAAHLRLAYMPGREGMREEHLAHARNFFRQALEVEPDLEFAHTNLGWLSLSTDPAAAVRHFAAALRLLPDRIGGYFGLGLGLIETGEFERARDAFALEIINDPAFLTSPAWDTDALAPHRAGALARAEVIAGEFASAPASVPQKQRRYTHALLRWWNGDASVVGDLIDLAPAPASDFFADVGGKSAEPWTGVPEHDTPGWRVLRAALADPAQRREILARFIFVRTRKPANRAEIDTLEQLLERLGADWRGWLVAPEGRDAPFVRSYRRDRFAYTILMRNPDLPIAHDAYLVQENRLTTLFFDYVFPARGWAPDALLLREVERIVR